MLIRTEILNRIFSASSFAFISLFLILFGLVLLGSGGTEDLSVFHQWLSSAFNSTLARGYEITQTDYPPFLIFTFYPIAFAKDIIGYWAVIHLSLLLNLLLSTLIFFRITKNSALALSFYFVFFYPAIILKYLDINYAPYLLLALFFLSRHRYFWFGVFFMCTSLVKWQPLILAPFFALYLMRQPHDKKPREYFYNPAIWKAVAGTLLIITFCIAYFDVPTMLQSLQAVLNKRELSGQALNLYWIVTYYLHINNPAQYEPLADGLINVILPDHQFLTLAKIPFIVFYFLTIVAYLKQENTFENLLKFSMTAFFTYFVLSTGVHENHIFTAVLLGLWLISINRQYTPLVLVIIVAYNFNVMIFEGFGRWLLPIHRVIGNYDITLPLAYLMLGFWIIYWTTQIFPLLFTKAHSPEILPAQ